MQITLVEKPKTVRLYDTLLGDIVRYNNIIYLHAVTSDGSDSVLVDLTEGIIFNRGNILVEVVGRLEITK